MRVLKEEKGFGLVEFLLALFILSFVVFVPVFYHDQMDQYDRAKAELYRFLDRVQVEGYLTIEDEARLYQTFEAMGCPIVEVRCPREANGDPRILRGPDVEASTITLEITYRPAAQDRIGILASLIGAGDEEDFVTTIRGSAVSERVDP